MTTGRINQVTTNWRTLRVHTHPVLGLSTVPELAFVTRLIRPLSDFTVTIEAFSKIESLDATLLEDTRHAILNSRAP